LTANVICSSSDESNHFPSAPCTSDVRCCCGFASEVEFDELAKNPAGYNGKEVTIKGLLQVAGDDNFLWRDVRARAREDYNRDVIRLVPDLSLPPYPGANLSPDSPANYKWVRVTGIVNTSFHGRFGEESFGVMQKRIEVLPGRRQTQFLTILGWFHNETPRPVKMDVISLNQRAEFTLGPGDIESTAVGPDGVTAVVKTKRDKTFARCLLTLPKLRRYYDSRKHAYYFRVLKDRIEPVLPTDVSRWPWMPMPDRD
jgi:hypothetical protein